MKITKIEWNLLVIDDPNCLPGITILQVMNAILKVVTFNYVILNDIEGAGNKDGVIASLWEEENQVMEISELLKVLPDIKQFDWGDFFLFKEHPKIWDNPFKKPYPYIIAQTDTTIRAVDDQYVYVYTPLIQIIEALNKEGFVIESVKKDILDNLEYPY